MGTSRSLSAIVPTYNRAAILTRTLEALAAQEDVPPFEVIVADDGSTDGTRQVVAELLTADRQRSASGLGMKRPPSAEFRYLYQENRGAAAARNLGLQHAEGEIVLFLDDDSVGFPTLVTEHLRGHTRCPAQNVAVLGLEVLAPEVKPTPVNLSHVVARWELLKDRQEVSWRHFLTGNISLKRSFLLEHGLRFDESLARFQDTEMGYRAAQKGLRIVYSAKAACYHLHHLDFDGWIRMNRDYGRALAVLHRRYPELRRGLGSYMPFSWRNSPGRVLHDLLRPLVLNRFTAEMLATAARRLEQSQRDIPAFVSHRAGNYYERQAYLRMVRQQTLKGASAPDAAAQQSDAAMQIEQGHR